MFLKIINSKAGKFIRTYFINLPLFCIVPVIVTVFSVLTLFQARETCMRFIVEPACTLILFVAGVRISFDASELPVKKQVVYISNHQSTYDKFIVCAIGLRNTRHFMKATSFVIIPLTLLGLCIRIFYIAPQSNPQKRIRCFKNAESSLRKTGESVFLSPEGTRITTGEIGKFNRGAFHLAINLQLPIVPLFFGIPEKSNPWRGFIADPGIISVKIMKQFDTKGLTVDDVDSLKNRVRSQYVAELKKFKKEDRG